MYPDGWLAEVLWHPPSLASELRYSPPCAGYSISGRLGGVTGRGGKGSPRNAMWRGPPKWLPVPSYSRSAGSYDWSPVLPMLRRTSSSHLPYHFIIQGQKSSRMPSSCGEEDILVSTPNQILYFWAGRSRSPERRGGSRMSQFLDNHRGMIFSLGSELQL